jgi:hypothetical protein
VRVARLAKIETQPRQLRDAFERAPAAPSAGRDLLFDGHGHSEGSDDPSPNARVRGLKQQGETVEIDRRGR